MIRNASFFILFFVIGGIFGYLIKTSGGDTSPTLTSAEELTSCEYDLVNPSFCNSDEQSIHINQAELERNIATIIDLAKNQEQVTEASVYFRDLKNGPIVNIDASEDYYAGSLLKVPILLLYMKYAEKDPEILNKKVTVTADTPLSQLTDQSHTAIRGKSYTVYELLQKMIAYSDNSSKEVLRKNASKLLGADATIDAVLRELGVKDTAYDDGLVSLSEYAAIFRSLYNAQYLNPEMSQKALGILTESEFDRGIGAGLPKDMILANKFGVPEAAIAKGKQLHDCGIVYYPQSPYIVCIFTSGEDYFQMEKVITDISREVYTAVDAVGKEK